MIPVTGIHFDGGVSSDAFAPDETPPSKFCASAYARVFVILTDKTTVNARLLPGDQSAFAA